MHGHLKTITGTIPNTTKEVNINVEGKHLIITGGNGCGKTSFLNDLYYKLGVLLKFDPMKDNPKPIEPIGNLDDFKHMMKKFRTSKLMSKSIKTIDDNILGDDKNKLELFQKNLIINNNNITRSGYISIEELYNGMRSIIKYYNADRAAQIDEPQGIKNNLDISNLSIKDFEQYSVNLKAQKSFAITENLDRSLSDSIDKWFKELEQNMAYLMEDKNLKLQFDFSDINKFKFYLQQQGKEKYTFQTLSRGYSAIFAIFIDLIMKSKAHNILPTELRGILLVDEIDAHLHVSLQRKILPFLTKSFPNIQFVVTTHSPFIMTSLSDAVIYDLSTDEQYEDLSMYSYENVVESVLNVEAISQDLLSDVDKLTELSQHPEENLAKIQEIINKIKPYEDKLDTQSKVFYHQAINKILTTQIQQRNV